MREGTTQRIHVNWQESPVTYTPVCRGCRTRISPPQPSKGAAQQKCANHRKERGCPK